MAQRRAHHGNGRFTLLEHPDERPVEPGGVAFGGGEHRVVERQCGAVGDRHLCVLELDPAAIAGIERELFQLGPGQETVAAEMADEKLDRIAAGGDLVCREAIGNHLDQVASGIGITANCRRLRRVVKGAPQRASRRQVAGLDNHKRVAGRAGKEAAEQRAVGIAGVTHPNQASTAHQADLRRFVE